MGRTLCIYGHYVLDENNDLIEIDKKNINIGEIFFYIGSTPSTPSDFWFLFFIKKAEPSEDCYGIEELFQSFEYSYFNTEVVKEKIKELKTSYRGITRNL